MNSRLELVVARHHEDLAWLRRVPREMVITVYDKGDRFPGGIPLPNHGREAHTYLHHIVERGGTLADTTIFVQGRPFDHAHDLHGWLRSLVAGRPVDGFWWLGFLADTDDSRGRRLFVPWSKNADRRELALDEFHRRLFQEPGPPAYRFFVGGQFAVTRDAVLRRPADFYRQALALSLAFPDAAHCFERCWDRVFLHDGTAGRLPPGQSTAWFKPVRRLLAPAAENPNPPLVDRNKAR